MEWIKITFNWYLMLFFLGVIFFPLTKKIFGKFFIDYGYPFSKTLAILFLSYAIFVFGIIKLLLFTQTSLYFLIILFIILNFIILKKNGFKTDKQWLMIIFEEIIFLAGLIFWTYIRGQEPSLRSLEKFMDFGFINSILRSKFFPPLDIWLSADPSHPNGYPINYYYFGHLSGAVLIKLSGVKSAIGYNLILATIFALSITQVFSLVINIVFNYLKTVKNFILNELNLIKLALIGLLGAFIVNLGGNLHTIYLFTSGYPNEQPIPFWKILSNYNPTKYWYPNATRFIPFTIHEFPSYSYVVADLHGHVFDIPFVLLTIAILLLMILKHSFSKQKSKVSNILNTKYLILDTIFLGFLIAVHYMTNAFDGPIYILLVTAIFFMLYQLSLPFFINIGILILSFILFSYPFSHHFEPFVTGIGVNCSPDFLTNIGRLGPFLFEKGNCQASPLWMLFVLWGFFWINFLIFIIVRIINNKEEKTVIDKLIFIFFALGTLLIIIPEFFYIKDIYPAHFRANTMFKLGYQAFIMMGIASTYTFFQIRNINWPKAVILRFIFVIIFFLIFLYPFYSIPSYYGNLDRPVELDGMRWLADTYPEDKEIVDFLNEKIEGQPVILEAQGDSYTDFERISANTGLPTVAGWWVHEWLWRGSSDVVGKIIPDIVNLYESKDQKLTQDLLEKYKVNYVIVSKMEKQKYSKLNEIKFSQLGKLIFKTSNGSGAIYQVNSFTY